MPELPPNRLVSACAGSGKTSALIERLRQLLQSGVAPGEILAITFTRKAAEEIEVRLLDDLQRAAAADEEWARACRRRLLLAETAADELNIHTFHGWFALLLAGRRWSDGWYGPAELCEDDSVLRQKAWRYWLDNLPPALDAALDAVLELCSPLTLETLLSGQFAHQLNAYRLLEDKTFPPPDLEAAAPPLQQALSAFAQTTDAFAGVTWQKAAVAADAMLLALKESPVLVAGPMPSAFQDTQTDLYKAFFTASGTVRQHLCRRAEKTGVTDLLERTAAAVRHYSLLCMQWRVSVFHQHFCLLADHYADMLARVKNENNQMSFDDLEYDSFCAVRACGDVNHLLYRVNNRYRHILIDEFQDTSPLQWHIIRCWLAAAAGSEQAPSVFIVGDVKQAIYRFRHGDARLLQEAETYLTQSYQAAVQENNCCYRLAPPLLQLINTLFPPLLADFPAHSVAECNRALPGRVEWHDLNYEKPAAPPPRIRNPLRRARPEDSRRRNWANAIVGKVTQIIGNWQLGEDDSRRPACAEDILILLPQFTHARVLRQALVRQGIPCLMRGGGSSFTDALACRDMVALLKVLLSPDNQLSLAQVLKSPLFACSEAELMEIFAGGGWAQLLASRQPAARVAADTLRRWRGWAQTGTLPVHDLLQRIFSDGDVIARYRAAVAAPERRQVSADLSALLDFSLAHSGGRQPLLPQFLEAIAAAKSAASATSATPDAGVRLMTVHGAKGLEAPIVILADCGFASKHSSGGKQQVQLLLNWEPSDPAPQRMIFCPTQEKAAFPELVEQEAQRADDEYNNLFYVALTRARQGLFIFSFAENSNPRLDRLREVMCDIGQADTALGIDGSDCYVLGESLAVETEASTSPPASVSAPSAPPVLSPLGEAIPPAVIRAGARGKLLHQQLALLLQGYDDEQIIRAVGGADLLPQAQALLRQPPLPALLSEAKRIAVENEFMYENKLMRLDLLIFTERAIWIVDYKTGSADVAAHAEQMKGYIDCVTAVYPDTPVKAAFVTPRGFHEYSH